MNVLSTIALSILCFATFSANAQDIALVLTGGGARCLAQVGVLKVLEREGITPNMIVGSSFGGIIGGLYSAGYSGTQIESMFRAVDWDELVSLGSASNREFQYLSQKFEDDRSIITVRFNDFSFVPPTAIGGNTRFSFLLQKVFWASPFNSAQNFDSLSPRLRVVATNLASGRPEILSEGNLATAIRASATFPLRYSPVRWNDSTVLVDGGLVANIPTEAARDIGAKKIILVNTISKLSTLDNVRSPWAVADQSLTAAMMQRDSVRLSLADVTIEPELSNWATFEFRSIDSLIALGERATEAVLPEIRSLVGTGHHQSVFDVQTLDLVTTDNDTTLALFVLSELRTLNSTVSNRSLRISIHDILHKHGYQFAFVRSIVSAAQTNRILVTVDKGLLTERTFEHVGGSSAVRVAREAAFPDSSNITLPVLERAWNNLHAADAFAESDIHIAQTIPEGTAVRVSALGNGNQALRLGARVDNERYTQGSMELSHDDIFVPGLRLSVIGNLSERIGSISAGFEIPRIYGSLWTTTLRGYSSFRNVWTYNSSEKPSRLIRSGEFSEDRFGARLTAGRALERNGIVLAELRYEMQSYRDLSSTVRPAYQPLATIRGVARWDDRDNVSFPTKGRTIDLSAETSVLSLSNDLSFTKLTASISSVFQWSWFTITPSVLLGAADKTLPQAELFSLGGQDLFFGMREDQRRGRQIIVGNADLRAKLPFRIFYDTYISLRYDFGAVWEMPEYIRIDDLNHGAGITIGVDTPIGPVRVSSGRAFTFTSQPSRLLMGPTLVYFAVGVRF